MAEILNLITNIFIIKNKVIIKNLAINRVISALLSYKHIMRMKKVIFLINLLSFFFYFTSIRPKAKFYLTIF